MKLLFWALLVANLLLFGALRWGGHLLDDGQASQEQPLLYAEKIRLLDLAQSTPPEIQTLSAPAATAVSSPSLLLNKSGNTLCLEWGDFSGADLIRATNSLARLQLGDKLIQRGVEHSLGYWVYIPPLKDRASFNRKIAQLKVRGIEEYFVVQEPGQWLNAISLGVFKTQEAAQKFTEELRKNDVHSTKIGERNSKFKLTVFTLNGVDETARLKVADLQKSFPGSELSNVICN